MAMLAAFEQLPTDGPNRAKAPLQLLKPATSASVVGINGQRLKAMPHVSSERPDSAHRRPRACASAGPLTEEEEADRDENRGGCIRDGTERGLAATGGWMLRSDLESRVGTDDENVGRLLI